MRYLQLVELGQSPVKDVERLPEKERAQELLAIGLRQIKGVNIQDFHEATGLDARELLRPVEKKLLDANLVTIDETKIQLTRKGVLVCDWIATEVVSL